MGQFLLLGCTSSNHDMTSKLATSQRSSDEFVYDIPVNEESVRFTFVSFVLSCGPNDEKRADFHEDAWSTSATDALLQILCSRCSRMLCIKSQQSGATVLCKEYQGKYAPH